MKILRLLLLIILPFSAFAQKESPAKPDESSMKTLIRSYMLENKSSLKLTDEDINNWMISDLYSNEKSKTTYIYVHQQVNGIRIFNAVTSVSVQQGHVKSFAKRLYPDAKSKINTEQPSLSAIDAIKKTASHLNLKSEGIPKLVSTEKKLNRTYYSAKDISPERIRVELVYQPVKKLLRLAYDVNIRFADGSHWWNVRIDAVTGDVLEKNDWVQHCEFGESADSESTSSSLTIVSSSPSTVNQSSSVAAYRVFPLPLEAPSFGSSVLVPDPADATASPFGWHDTNGSAGAEFTTTRGNNVFAYDDIANIDAPGTSANGGAPLNFDFPVNIAQQPSTYLNGSITNLFYINNMLHDRLYHYGFDEAAGNFQETNYSGQGNGSDYVIAECQDGGGTDNANFATPDDGQSGRMQMYLWSGSVQSIIVVNSPAAIAGNYTAMPAGFGPSIVTPITANLVIVDDATGTITDACEPLINGASLSGKIAVIDRGNCDFVDKVLLAQNAGAIAVIMINNSPGSIMAMGDNGNGFSVTIPSEMISMSDGDIIKASIAGGATVNATLNPPPSTAVDIDGSLDNGIVIHEYGHGVSTRLTGGPMNSSCLFNGEEGGEGWSDFFALLFTMKDGDVGTSARGVGTFAIGQSTSGYGIRRYPYSTDITINPETYGFLAQSGEVHDIGEVWCMVLWEMNWTLIDQLGFDPDWINGTGGNNITLSLVMEGLKLQPCSPGFLDGRDAILLADDNLYGGIHKCLIWEAFAKRGMGFNADQGDANTAGDEIEDFTLPPACLIPTSAPTANFNADVTTSCIGIIRFSDLSTNIPQAWSWDFGDSQSSTLQNPVHTYTQAGTFNVTLIVTNTLGGDTMVKTSYVNVTIPSAPTVSGDSIICNGDSTTLTANVSGGNVAEWRNASNTLVFTGNVFNTPGLTSSTTYQLSQSTVTPLQNVGPLNDSIGTGGYHNSTVEGRLLFTTFAPMRLRSAWVDASGAGFRDFNLYGQGNTLIQTLSINVPNGQSRVTLNFDIPSPGNYQVGVTAGSNLYRNNSGAIYPYNISGLVSITNSNNPPRYYYLYDWEVQELPCTSPQVPVSVMIDAPSNSFTYQPNGLSVQFTNTSGGSPVSFFWDFGNSTTSTLQDPVVNYVADGTYTVTLTITNANGCQSVSSQQVTAIHIGINSINNETANIFYSGKDLVIKFDSPPSDIHIRIYDPIGKLLLNTQFSGSTIFSTQLANIAAEFLMVNIVDGDKTISKKIVIPN